MGQLGHGREQLRLDVLAGAQQLRRLDPGRPRSLDEILALDREQPQLVAPAPLRELADELELLVVPGGDQEAWGSAAFARSAIAPNAAGTLTAISASTLRSSSTPAARQPAMNWL